MQCLADYKVSPSNLAVRYNINIQPLLSLAKSKPFQKKRVVNAMLIMKVTMKRQLQEHQGVGRLQETCHLSRRTTNRYQKDASYTEELVNKGDNVVTVGLDGTTKAPGHQS